MMTTIRNNRVVTALLILISMQQLAPLSVLVAAYPNGAGSCAGGRAAVEGSHLSTGARITGPLSDVGLGVALDVTAYKGYFILQDSKTSTMDFTMGENHTLTLTSLGFDLAPDDDTLRLGKRFRGFLFRLAPPPDLMTIGGIIDTREALDTSSLDRFTKVPVEQCIEEQSVGGLTHINNDLKDTATGVLRMEQVFEEGGPLPGLVLDVTAVIQNRNGLSEFYYSQFILNAVDKRDFGVTGPAPALTERPSTQRPTRPPTPYPTPTQMAPPPTPRAPTPVIVSSGPPVVIVVTTPSTRKVAAPAKCGSLSTATGRGGSAAQDKDCSSRTGGGGGTRTRRRRKLKGSSSN